MRDGIESNLWNRLSLVASQELVSLVLLLQDFVFSPEPDQRFLNGGKEFSTRRAYDLISLQDEQDPYHAFIWKSKAPTKVKISRGYYSDRA